MGNRSSQSGNKLHLDSISGKVFDKALLMGIYTMPNPKTELTSLYSFPQDFRASSTLPCRTTPTRRSPVKLQLTDHPTICFVLLA
jgi:hypothetical protein